MREEVLRTYKNDLPERIPLSQQKEIRRIKNIVIQEAVQLGEQLEHTEDQSAAPAPQTAPAGQRNNDHSSALLSAPHGTHYPGAATASQSCISYRPQAAAKAPGEENCARS